VTTAIVCKQHVDVAVGVQIRRHDRVRGRAAAGQLGARREAAAARVEKQSAGTVIVPKQHVEVAVAVDVRRRDRVRLRAAAGQLDARRKAVGAPGHGAGVEEDHAGTAINPNQHVEDAVAVHIRRRDRSRLQAAAGQLDARPEGACAVTSWTARSWIIE